MRRLRIGVIFGGRSVEHEISLVSARSVLEAIDPERYEVVPIGVTRSGKWLTSSDPGFLEEGFAQEVGEHAVLLADPSVGGLARVEADGDHARARDVTSLDVIFPLIHGAYGEDGKLQGLLEMADLPYVGSGVLGSAVGMDKEVAKRLFGAAGLPVVDFVLIRGHEWTGQAEEDHEAGAGAAAQSPPVSRADETVRVRIEKGFGYPCFVKPACLGSSVGVTRARDWKDARSAISEAFSFDEKVLVERAVDAREIEVAVLGNETPAASIPGEILPGREFYDYEAKYHDEKTKLLIPAPLPADLSDRIRAIAIEAFRALELSGMARVDFLLDRRSGVPFLNEVNTIPGFTPVSMYPKLWQASGLSYPALVDRLIQLALERHRSKNRLRTSRDTAESSHA